MLVAHNAGVRPPRAAPGVRARGARRGPSPPALCTVALARRFAPARAPAAARSRSPSRSGSTSTSTHRALADAETCARVFCALFGRLCANATTVARRARARCAPRRPRAPARGATRTAARRACAARAGGSPTSAGLPDDPGVYVVPQRRGPGALRRQVGRAAHARAGALRARRPPRARGPRRPRSSTTRPTSSELGALVLESRLIKRAAPARQRAPQARRPLRLPALPPRHRLPGARGRARARAPGTR